MQSAPRCKERRAECRNWVTRFPEHQISLLVILYLGVVTRHNKCDIHVKVHLVCNRLISGKITSPLIHLSSSQLWPLKSTGTLNSPAPLPSAFFFAAGTGDSLSHQRLWWVEGTPASHTMEHSSKAHIQFHQWFGGHLACHSIMRMNESKRLHFAWGSHVTMSPWSNWLPTRRPI